MRDLRCLTRPALARLAVLAAALLLITGLAAAPEQLTILHFNDLHGNLLAPEEEGELGGMARLATTIRRIRAENEARGVDTLVLIAGDVLQGTPLSTVFRGEADFVALNAIGIDAMTVGNHEFDFGMPNLHRLIDLAQFPLLSANIRRKADGTAVFPGTERFTVGDEMVVVIGLTTPETRVTTKPSNVANLEFEDPVEVATVLADRITRSRDRLVIALTHLGYEEDLRLGQAVPALDVIVGGHSHTQVDEAARAGNALVVQALAYGDYLGRLDLDFDAGRVNSYEYRLIPMDASVPEDEQVAAIVAGYAGRLDEAMQRVVGHTTVPLDGEREHVRAQETNLGNAITDAMRLVSGSPIALHNGGGIRASIDAGPITLAEVLQVLPFRNEVATVELTGAQLREILERSISQPRPHGGFLQVSGLKLTVEGDRLAEVLVGAEPLDPQQTYVVTTNDFLLEGGDGYETFTRGRNQYHVGTKLDTAFVQYLVEMGTIAPAVEERIVFR
ncbi:MAG: bifunctional UDP-sugar hydrolase/5'-nucleotidase [Armatimonadota bacterium]